MKALREGLQSVIPVQLLPLFTWQELEQLVCGRRRPSSSAAAGAASMAASDGADGAELGPDHDGFDEGE